MKAARILEYKKPLVLEDISVPDIQPDEVLVKVAACGMCRSDVLLIDGFFQSYGNIPPPVIPGHEITGTIEKIGGVVPKVAGLQEGDHVVSLQAGVMASANIAKSVTHISAPMYVGPVLARMAASRNISRYQRAM